MQHEIASKSLSTKKLAIIDPWCSCFGESLVTGYIPYHPCQALRHIMHQGSEVNLKDICDYAQASLETLVKLLNHPESRAELRSDDVRRFLRVLKHQCTLLIELRASFSTGISQNNMPTLISKLFDALQLHVENAYYKQEVYLMSLQWAIRSCLKSFLLLNGSHDNIRPLPTSSSNDKLICLGYFNLLYSFIINYHLDGLQCTWPFKIDSLYEFDFLLKSSTTSVRKVIVEMQARRMTYRDQQEFSQYVEEQSALLLLSYKENLLDSRAEKSLASLDRFMSSRHSCFATATESRNIVNVDHGACCALKDDIDEVLPIEYGFIPTFKFNMATYTAHDNFGARECLCSESVVPQNKRQRV